MPSKTTVIVKLAVPTFPAASVAVQVIVLVPTGQGSKCHQPKSAEWLKFVFGSVQVTLTLPSTLSVADSIAVNKSIWSPILTVNNVSSFNIITGASPSTTVLSVVTVTDIGAPIAGNIAFSSGESKFKGYDGTNWQDLH